MSRNSLRSVKSIPVLFLILVSASLSFSQGKTTEPVNLVTLKITAPNGTWGIVAAAEGEMITMVDEKTGTGFGFTVAVINAKERSVEVKVTPITGFVQDTKVAESLNVSIGSPKTTGASFKVEVKAIARELPASESETGALFKRVAFASSAVQNCCVNCGGMRLCANCFVTTECGCCCTSGPGCCSACP